MSIHSPCRLPLLGSGSLHSSFYTLIENRDIGAILHFRSVFPLLNPLSYTLQHLLSLLLRQPCQFHHIRDDAPPRNMRSAVSRAFRFSTLSSAYSTISLNNSVIASPLLSTAFCSIHHDPVRASSDDDHRVRALRSEEKRPLGRPRHAARGVLNELPAHDVRVTGVIDHQARDGRR